MKTGEAAPGARLPLDQPPVLSPLSFADGVSAPDVNGEPLGKAV
jgi:hypothetical protein